MENQKNNLSYICGMAKSSWGIFMLLLTWALPVCAEPILPLSIPDGLSEEKIQLGDKLFHDPRFSSDNTISCANCHILALGGADNSKRSVGVQGRLGTINAPTVFNVSFHLSYFWDGRAVSLEEQIAGPVNNPVEMHSSWDQVIGKLQQDPVLIKAFDAIYPQGIDKESIADAIAAFEKALTTVDAPFDLWLKGDETALTAEQLEGYRLFQSYGCVACHQGKAVGGNMYATMGEMGNYFEERGGKITSADLGRYNVTGNENDRYVFKVPSLRLATKTAPYFHDGSVKSLCEAINIMGRFQLGREIPPQECALIEVFLNSLAGTHPKITVVE